MRFFQKKQRLASEDFFSGETQLPSLRFSELPFIKGRLMAVLTSSIVIAVLFLGKAFYVEIVKGEEFSRRYESIHRAIKWIPAPRGLIKDRNGVILAVNGAGEKENELTRMYPQGPPFAHLLGFVGRVESFHLARDDTYLPFDTVGKAGIEERYERFLRGNHGRIENPITAKGELTQSPIETLAQPGSDVILTISSEVQKKLYEVLERQREKFKSPGAAGIMLNPKNGAVLALVSLPSFDNNAPITPLLHHPSRPLFNRAIGGEYPPGSTIKPLLAAAALSENLVNPEKIIIDRGKIEVPSIYDPGVTWTFHGWKALGPVDMRRAIAMSSNIYFYTIGGGYGEIKGLGIEKIDDYLRLFGWGKASGIDLAGEREGFLPSPEWKKEYVEENWFIGDTYNTSIGQGFLRVTPLQLALAATLIANGGTLYQPYLIDRAVSQEGKEIFRNIPTIKREKMFNPDTIRVVREGMRQAVQEGTVWRLKDLPVEVAAKTGTAQAGRGRPHHGWVTVFAPYDDPEIVLTILIENGEGGERSAVPAAKEFLQWYFDNK
ncbi:MAG: hypothetical protein HY001_04155 [Candidatus Portnoybacteria bacterium]|nr:hypothetical protein [Candidatus Portnoybacteria bacterium]